MMKAHVSRVWHGQTYHVWEGVIDTREGIRNSPKGLRFFNFNGERVWFLGAAEPGLHPLDGRERFIEPLRRAG